MAQDDSKKKNSKERKVVKTKTPKEVVKTKVAVVKITKKKSNTQLDNTNLDKLKKSSVASPRRSNLDRKPSTSNLADGTFAADEAAPIQQPNPAVRPYHKGELAEDIKHIMFGFGDSWEPDSESVEIMEEIVVEYIRDMTTKAIDVANMKGKLDTECFVFLLRKDKPKINRVKQLLAAYDEIRIAINGGFDFNDEKRYM